jgi:hypothetical protein
MSSPSRLALQTQLPASPEHNNIRNIPHFFIQQQQQQDYSYSATSPTRTLFENAIAESHPESRFQSLASYEKFQPKALACCTTLEGDALGAVAGSHGVALFSMDEMHKPVMMLNRALPAPVSLAFSAVPQNPLPQSNLLLASAQGNGILVWDVSGLRLSPLWGRLGMESRASIVSLAWYPGPLVTAATDTSLAAWDLRSHPSRPSLRFGVRKGDTVAPYVQMATGHEPHECAVLDAKGMFRIYDLRVTDRQSAGGLLYSFSALSYAGVGLATMDSGWLTWGLDEIGGDGVVKVWSREEDPSHTSRRLMGTIAQPNLACARVCPQPAESCFVTVSFEENMTQPAQWNATMWKATSRGLESTLSFLGGAELEQKQSEATQGTLCAAELTIHKHKEEATLLLCTLTNKGFLSSYVSKQRRKSPDLASLTFLFVFRLYLKPYRCIRKSQNHLSYCLSHLIGNIFLILLDCFRLRGKVSLAMLRASGKDLRLKAVQTEIFVWKIVKGTLLQQRLILTCLMWKRLVYYQHRLAQMELSVMARLPQQNRRIMQKLLNMKR